MKGKATSFDIAYYAGVSQSTVSRALRNSHLVSEQTREKIQKIAKELNYTVDKNASNLSTQQSNTIALLLFQDPTDDESQINPFFISMMSSIIRTCSENEFDLLVSFQELSDDWHSKFEDSHKADGLILLGYGDYTHYKDKLMHMEQRGTNFVRWGAISQQQSDSTIGCDNFKGGMDITHYLLTKGYKHFAFIGEVSKAAPEFNERFQGCNKALKDKELQIKDNMQFDAISTEASGYSAAEELLKSGQQFDAIICASDLIALGVISALRNHNINIPLDVAVVGYDNIPLGEFTRPPLTTMDQDTNLAGKLLVETLIKKIKNEDIKKTRLPAKLIIRESC